MTTIRRKTIFGALLTITLGCLTTSCSSEIAEIKAAEYCKCLREAKGEMTKVDDCLSIMDEAKVEFEKKPRIWIKFQRALEECQN
jgi:hypothetical protein